MTDRTISTEALGELYESTTTSLQRTLDDLLAVSESIDGIDMLLPSFDRGADLHKRASSLRAAAAHTLTVAAAISASASACETLALLVDHSRSLRPAVAPTSAKAAKKARGRKP